ncbi:flagellar export chaperone FlgN [Thalassiella azotivora]
MGLAEVSNVLWRERELLELLLFKLEEEQLLLAAGRTRWLPHATREVEVVLDQIRDAEALRAVEVSVVGEELGLGPEPSLRALVAAAPEPWTELLEGHRQAFLVLTQEIATTAEANRDAVAAGARAVHETLLAVEEPLHTYDPRGRAATASVAGARSHLVDEAL